MSALSLADRLLFIGLWSYVDDNGVGLDRVPVVAADLFADDLAADARETLARVERGLTTLSGRGLIHRYAAAGKEYLEVVTWNTHQKVDRPGKSRYPKSKEALDMNRESVASMSREVREGVATGEGEKGRRGEGDSDAPRRQRGDAPATTDPEDVLEGLQVEFGGLSLTEEQAARPMIERGEPRQKVANLIACGRREDGPAPKPAPSDPWAIGGGAL